MSRKQMKKIESSEKNRNQPRFWEKRRYSFNKSFIKFVSSLGI